MKALRITANVITVLLMTSHCMAGESSQSNIQENADIRVQLRETYTKYYEAAKKGDVRSWQNYASTYSVLEWKNMLLSTSQNLDSEYLKGVSSMMAPLDGLKELAIRRNKDTAKLILFGRQSGAKDSGNMHIVPSFHTIDFICEAGKWKVHAVGGKMPSELPGADVAIAKDDYSSVLTNTFFYPNGEIPALPKEVKSIDEKAMLNVQSGWYITKISINGYNQSPRVPIVDSSMVCPVIGGLRFGTNVIKIVVEKIDRPSSNPLPHYEVLVVRQNEDFDQVFAYCPTNEPKSHEETFIVERQDEKAIPARNMHRLPKQQEMLELCRKLDSTLDFKKLGNGFHGLYLAASVTGGVQRTINILPHPVAGEPVQGVNVILSTVPNVQIATVQDEIDRSMKEYMNDFVAKFVPETSCRILGSLITQMTGKGEGKPAKLQGKDGNLLFSLRKEISEIGDGKTLTWTLNITDLKAHKEAVAKELQERQ